MTGYEKVILQEKKFRTFFLDLFFIIFKNNKYHNNYNNKK